MYGRDKMRPKHHYAAHLPEQYRRFGFLVSCLTHERKHRLVKRYLAGYIAFASTCQYSVPQELCELCARAKHSQVNSLLYELRAERSRACPSLSCELRELGARPITWSVITGRISVHIFQIVVMPPPTIYPMHVIGIPSPHDSPAHN